MKKINKELLICILVPLVVGIVSGLLSLNGFREYSVLKMPSFAPPGFLFPIVWTILYILMGISSYLIIDSNCLHTRTCLIIYAVNLFLNFFWTLIFFGLGLRLFAFIWIILLDLVIIYMIMCFYNINKKAAFLNIPYLLWCLFATYLNLIVYLLNR